jgi:hypothetical protein
MRITESTVRKISILKEERDTINVFLEDFGPGAGRITIERVGEAWSHYWSHMGESHTITSFLAECDAPYLVNKLKPDMSSMVVDEDALPAHVRAAICCQRREGDLSKKDARRLFDRSELMGHHSEEGDFLYGVFGDEWWLQLSEKPNPDYLDLKEIVQTVQTALKTLNSPSTAAPAQ